MHNLLLLGSFGLYGSYLMPVLQYSPLHAPTHFICLVLFIFFLDKDIYFNILVHASTKM